MICAAFVATFLLAGAGYTQRLVEFFAPTDARVPAAVRTAAATPPAAELRPLQTAPVANFTTAVKAKDGALWLGSNQGAMRCPPDPAQRCDYFAGRRWLPDDEVSAIHVASPRFTWIRTSTGVARLEFRPMTLEQKTAPFEERIRLRHNRYSLIATSQLTRPGDLTSNRTFPNDNDGLWTAMYVAAEAFRYAATRSPAAKRLARESMRAVMRLEEITGIPGFPARAYIRRGDYRPPDGEWHWTPDGQFEWKGDTSSDEIVGHVLAYSVYYDLVADEAEKPALRAALARIVDYILNNGRYLLDVDGKPTTWGKWSLDYFNLKPPEGIGWCDAPLNAAELLAFIKAAEHLTGDARYGREYKKLLDDGYPQIAAKYLERRCEINYSDEELAMLSFYPLLEYERDPKLRGVYLDAMTQWWKNEQREESPLWIYIYNRGTGGRTDLDKARRTLERWPMDLVSWTVRNSHRQDIGESVGMDRFKAPEYKVLLPPDERPVMRWNGNPFRVDGGNGGRSEDDGSAFLLPYWMGRYYKYVE